MCCKPRRAPANSPRKLRQVRHQWAVSLNSPLGENHLKTNVFFWVFFLAWTIFKVLIEFVAILLLFYVLVFWPQGMWDLSSPTRDQTRNPWHWKAKS